MTSQLSPPTSILLFSLSLFHSHIEVYSLTRSSIKIHTHNTSLYFSHFSQTQTHSVLYYANLTLSLLNPQSHSVTHTSLSLTHTHIHSPTEVLSIVAFSLSILNRTFKTSCVPTMDGGGARRNLNTSEENFELILT